MKGSGHYTTGATPTAGIPGLRRARAADLSAVMAFQYAAFAGNRAILGVEPLPLLADYQAILRDMEIWLCEQANRLTGVLILEPRSDDLMIWSIATAPSSRHQGLGADLLAAAETRARQLGQRALTLYTGEKLTHLIAWYRRHGFAVAGIEASPDRRLVHMSKTMLSKSAA